MLEFLLCVAVEELTVRRWGAGVLERGYLLANFNSRLKLLEWFCYKLNIHYTFRFSSEPVTEHYLCVQTCARTLGGNRRTRKKQHLYVHNVDVHSMYLPFGIILPS